MGDPLSVASGIGGLLSIAGLVFSRTYKFAKAAKEADSSIQKLSSEIQALAGLLQRLSLIAAELETGPTDSAFRLENVISCRQLLLKIERRTQDADTSKAGDSKTRSFFKKLKWPFSSTETMEMIAEVTRHQGLITAALSADSITHLQKLLSVQDDIRKDIKDIQDELERQRELATRITMGEERKKVLEFFGAVDPSTNHETSKGLRHRQTGLWILSNENYVAWARNSGSRLWLSGIPGAGKTVLASVLIDEMMRQSTPEKAIAYFYCDYKDEQRQQLPNILGAIACQLARQDASQRCFALLQDYHKACHPPERPASSPKTSMLLGLIRDMSICFDEVSIVVDALDECGNNRTEVVESLAGLNDGALSNIRTAFLSRDELDIRMILEDFMHIPIAAHSEDLKIFVAEEIEARIRKKKLRIKSPALKNEIMERLTHGADGMFRWVACQIDYLCTLPHDRARREALASLPPDLNSTYERILGRVVSQPSNSERVTEYMSRICLAYLNCKDFNRFPIQEHEEWRAFIRKHPFHPHASQKWTDYASDHWNDQVIREQTQILFHPRKSLQFLNWAQDTVPHGPVDFDNNFLTVTSALTTNGISPLHLAAMYQLEWVVKWLLEEKVDANQSTVFSIMYSLKIRMFQVTEQSTILEILSVSKVDPTLSFRDHDGEHYNALDICLLGNGSPGELFKLFPGIQTG
ncbi:hypothetical protein SLS54_006859 [Diplodia seriata]